MLKRTLIFTLALVFLAQTAIAQDQKATKTSGDWTIVESLKTGEKLSIERKSGKSIKGKLASVSQTGLSISEGGKNNKPESK